MILGIGSDLIEIERISSIMERHGERFLEKFFSEKERQLGSQYKDPAAFYAGRWAAKESVAKALGTGFGEMLSWQDLEILPDSLGKPLVHLSKRAKARFEDPRILVTITHARKLAMAYAVWERKN